MLKISKYCSEIIKKYYLKIFFKLSKNKNTFIRIQNQNLFYFLLRNRKIIAQSSFVKTNYYPSLPKLFVVGHNKTGTSSIHDLFINNGYKSYHWELGILSQKIKQNFSSNSKLLRGIDDAHLYSDITQDDGYFSAYNLFPQLDLQYPGSYFIYNYRNLDEWLISRTKHGKSQYLENCIHKLNTNHNFNLNSFEDIQNHWRDYFLRHEAMVKKYFENKNNLIILNINDDKSKRDFCSKLRQIGFAIKDITIPHSFKTIS